MDSLSLSDPIILIRLQAVNLLPIGKLTEEYKPLLVLRKDYLEIRWKVGGKVMMARIERGSLSYHFEDTAQPFRIALIVKSPNLLSRQFISDDLIAANNVDLRVIVAIAKPSDAKKAPWSKWAEGLDSFSYARRIWLGSSFAIEALALDLSTLATGQLRKSNSLSIPSRRPSSATIDGHRSPIGSVADEEQKITEHLERAALAQRPVVGEVATPVNEEHALNLQDMDPTLCKDAERVLLAWQSITARMRSASDRHNKTLEEQKRKHERQQDETAAKEKSLKQQLDFVESEKKMLKNQQDRMTIDRMALKRQQKALLDREACLVEKEEVLEKATMELQNLAKKRRAR